MAIIDPEGLFGGNRIRALSDKAKLYWPWLYTACNGYARMELNPPAILQRCFSSFTNPPSEAQLLVILSEYAENFLLFAYEHDGERWIQWDTPAKLLPRHKTKRDEASPSPSLEARTAFDNGYLQWKQTKSFSLHHARHNFALFRENSHGIGVGIGGGVGGGEGTHSARPDSPTPAPEVIPPPPPPPPEPAAPTPVRPTAAGIHPLGSVNAEVETLVQKICISHPRSLARKQRFNEAPWSHKTAVMDAARDEVIASGCSLIAALEMMLQRVEMHAREIPPGEYRYLKDIQHYFALHEYRMESEEFRRNDGKRSANSTKTGGTLDALAQARAFTRGRAAPGGHPDASGEVGNPAAGAP